MSMTAMADAPLAQTTAAAAASAAAPATQAAPASATAAVPLPTCQEIKAFKDKLHKAIDAALQFPAELSFYPAVGVTIVGYDYQDGKVSGVHITQKSNDGRIDRAALRAVQDADYASITPGIGSLKLHDSVIVVFDNSGNSEKNVAEQQKQADPVADSCEQVTARRTAAP
jgi:outer membrane biosynthesis protein TonB